jgi:hypothetical protein
VKLQQVKQNEEMMEKEGEGEIEQQINGARDGAFGQKWKWHGSEMAVREIEHLSIFSNANQ